MKEESKSRGTNRHKVPRGLVLPIVETARTTKILEGLGRQLLWQLCVLFYNPNPSTPIQPHSGLTHSMIPCHGGGNSNTTFPSNINSKVGTQISLIDSTKGITSYNNKDGSTSGSRPIEWRKSRLWIPLLRYLCIGRLAESTIF